MGVAGTSLGCKAGAVHRPTGFLRQIQCRFPVRLVGGVSGGPGKGYRGAMATNDVKRADATYAGIQIRLNGNEGTIGKDDL
jgi:hypothetical protein